MLKKLLFLLPFLFMIYWTPIQCLESCDKLGTLLYEEIGCQPIKNNPDDPCPSSYDCKHLEASLSEECYFQGKKYKDREELPYEALSETCNGGCFCNIAPSLGYRDDTLIRDLSKKFSFTCAAYDCPEFIGGNPLTNPDCIRTYKLGSCCASGQICPPFDNITTCQNNGVTYKDGQRFSPKHSCSDCVCQKGFTGKYEPPFCKRMNCGTELRHAGDIRNKCAPVYKKDAVRCCPLLWVCPSELDVFTAAQKDSAFEKTCKFGEKEIRNGQVLQTSLEEYGQKYDIKCNCQIPPLLTCIIQHSEHIQP